jgi:hypothetical protein
VPRIAFVVIVIGLTGCSTARVSQFDRFAEAGGAYVGAVDELARVAAVIAVDADSAVLARARQGLSGEERAMTVMEHDGLLRERVMILDDLRRHARLLEAYFASLAALADSDAPQAIAGATGDLVASLEAVGVRLAGARVGELRVDDLTGGITEIAIAGFRRAGLEQELEARGPAIRTELDIQRAAVQAIAETMRTDLEVVIAQRELIDVVEPYRQRGELARIWTDRRRDLLTANAALGSADAAVRAAEGLQTAFDALLERRFGVAEYMSVLADINQILSLIEAARGLQSGRS